MVLRLTQRETDNIMILKLRHAVASYKAQEERDRVEAEIMRDIESAFDAIESGHGIGRLVMA